MQIKQGVIVFANNTLHYLLGFFSSFDWCFCVFLLGVWRSYLTILSSHNGWNGLTLYRRRALFLLESLFLLTILRLSSMSKWCKEIRNLLTASRGYSVTLYAKTRNVTFSACSTFESYNLASEKENDRSARGSNKGLDSFGSFGQNVKRKPASSGVFLTVAGS